MGILLYVFCEMCMGCEERMFSDELAHMCVSVCVCVSGTTEDSMSSVGC